MYLTWFRRNGVHFFRSSCDVANMPTDFMRTFLSLESSMRKLSNAAAPNASFWQKYLKIIKRKINAYEK